MKQKSSLFLIKKAFDKRKKENPKLSIRSLANKTGVSNGFLSKVLSGQKTLTPELALKLSDHLQMDDFQKEQLAVTFGKATLSNQGTQASTLEEYELAPANLEWILSKWYITAVLDLITCEGFQESPDWIAGRLEILPSQAKEALTILEQVGLLDRDQTTGILKKKYLRIRFPTKISKSIIRDFHLAQMRRAAQLLNLRTAQQDFEARLITGLTVAANPEKLKGAIAILHNALYEAANLLSEGPCVELYQINLQLFPQTRLKK